MKHLKKILFYFILTLLICSCNENQTTRSGLELNKFTTEYENKKISLYILRNKTMEVCVTNFGCRIVSITVPDKHGIIRDVTLGFNSIDEYINKPSSFGATIGRVANRIKNGRFILDNKEYILPKNSGNHCIHGGNKGFQYKIFDVQEKSDTKLVMTYISPDGEEGFPGEIKCKVTILLTDNNEIDITYSATTNKPTVINMTNHTFFNLDGDPSKDISEYVLFVDANYYTPIDSSLTTIGTINKVEGTPLNFTTPHTIGKNINNKHEQLSYAKGIDHNYVLNNKGDITKECAFVYSPNTGIKLSVYTNEPGLQVYTANSLNGSIKGKKEIKYKSRSAICLETQHFPDSPNKENWPTIILRENDKYISKCIYRFSIDK